jgi:Tfp pilus assembly protein PilF
MWGAACKVASPHKLSEAEVVFQKGDHAQAATLLEADLARTPGDPDETALLVRALLWQQKTAEASDALNKALLAHPDSATLLTEKAEVLYRQGKPWEMGSAVVSALKADPCFPRAYMLYSWLMSVESNRASWRKAVQTAHQLDPNDDEIRTAWMNTLPLVDRIAAVQADIDSGRITDSAKLEARKKDLDALKKLVDEPPKQCRLASQEETAEVPMLAIMAQQRGGAQHGSLEANSYGLGVRINGHESMLQIDTGASGLTISKSAAEHAGLKLTQSLKVGGIGDEGPAAGHLAYADSIQIGGLEFKDCAVTVLDKLAIGEQDGIIGTDVFSAYLLTLDYPMHKLVLAQLPRRPDEPQQPETRLATSGSDVPDSKPANSGAAGAAGKTNDSQNRLYDRYIAPEMKDYLPVYRVGHDLITPGSLHKPDLGLFIIDTGAWATYVTSDAARPYTKVDENRSQVIIGLNGKVEHPYVAEVVDVSFGGISKRLLGVPAISLNRGFFPGMEVSGLIGADILQDLTIHLDYRDGLVKFDYDPKRGFHPLNRDTAY